MKAYLGSVGSTRVATVVQQANGLVGLLSYELLKILQSLGPNPNSTVVAVPVGASPFIYTNATDYQATAVVSGGAVSSLAFSRDGVNFFPFASASPSSFTLNPGDLLRVTYTVAPTITVIPR